PQGEQTAPPNGDEEGRADVRAEEVMLGHMVAREAGGDSEHEEEREREDASRRGTLRPHGAAPPGQHPGQQTDGPGDGNGRNREQSQHSGSVRTEVKVVRAGRKPAGYHESEVGNYVRQMRLIKRLVDQSLAHPPEGPAEREPKGGNDYERDGEPDVAFAVRHEEPRQEDHGDGGGANAGEILLGQLACNA